MFMDMIRYDNNEVDEKKAKYKHYIQESPIKNMSQQIPSNQFFFFFKPEVIS